jgi:uncharacterized membrane protein YbhN (UPF0104 family)
LKPPVKPLLLVLATAASGYALALLLGSGAPWRQLTAVLAAPAGALAAGLCVLSYLLRGQRWRLWLALQGRALPLAQGLRLYLAGYTFTPTPGNVGEAMRGLLLRPPLGAGVSVGLYGAERLADLLALLLLALLALPWLQQRFSELPWLPALIAMVSALGLLSVALLWRWRARLLQRLGWLQPAWRCLTHRPVRWLALTVLAWSMQGLAVWLLGHALGLDLTAAQACGFYALAMVAGALSLLPAGLGGTEAVFAGLLTLAGAPLASALVMTVLVRLLTLWLAVAIGTLALLYSAALRRDLSLH